MPHIHTWLTCCRRLLHHTAARHAAARSRLRLEQLEARMVPSGLAPTGVEQEYLQRLNAARANPAAYGRSIGLDLSGVAPSQALAFDPRLIQSSRGHSADMNAHNFFGHYGSDGSDPFQRMTAAGFPWLGAEESIAAGYPTPESALAGLIIDAGEPDLGHRKQMLSIGGSPYQDEQETGVGIVLNGTGIYRNYYTIDSGNTADTRPILTGVVYDDLNHNGLYDNGEGLGNVVITAAGTGGGYRTATWGSGGYSLPVAPGTYTVTASGGALAAPVSHVVTVGGINYPLDFTFPTGVTATALTSSLNPSRAGQTVTLTATVTGGGLSGKPTGTVEFFDGTTDLGPGSPLSGSGTHARSVLVTSALSAGTRALKAVFSPTGVFRASQGTLTQAVRADHLAFDVEPSDTVAGTPVAPAVQVWLLDPLGNLQTGDNSDRVTLTLAAGPGRFTSGSTTTVTVKGGVATFDNLVLTTAGSYTLKATATGGVTGTNSVTFVVSPAAADHLAFSVPPGLVVVGQAINPAVQVQVQDRFGNVLAADDTDQVTLSVASGPGGFTAGSATTATVSGGVAIFDNLVLTASGVYTLGETATGGLTGPNSAAFTAALFTDDFNRPDAPSLGPNWTVVGGTPGVRGNRLVLIGGPGIAVYQSATPANVGVQADIALPTTGTAFASVIAGSIGPGVPGFYRGQVVGSNGQFSAGLVRFLGGKLTPLVPAVPVAGGTGTLRLEVVGNSLKLFLNGRLVAHAFDSALAVGGVGVWGSAGAALDNFEADAINLLPVALPFHDGFAATAGGQLSRSWTERAGNFQVLGNGQLRADDAGLSLATLNLAPTVADVALQANVVVSATGSQFAGLTARYSGAGGGSMYLGMASGGNGHFAASIYRKTGTTWTLLSSRALTRGTGLLRFVVKGSRLQLFWSGVLVCDVNDTVLATAGLAGLAATQGALYANFTASAP
jgi:uncharacterized protein YkwD